jgi:cobalt-zinc-cadmium efflux system outer membrane protein
VTFTLPILNQNQGPIAEAKARRELAAAHFLTVQAQAIAEIDSALIGYQAALQQVATAEALQKNLRRQLNSVRAQVQEGEAEPLTEASAEVEFVTGAQHRLNARVQAQQALGQVEDAVQSPLTLSQAVLDAAEKDETKTNRH